MATVNGQGAPVAPPVKRDPPTRFDARYVPVTDARAKLRAWTGNISVDLGGWLGDADSAWDFYSAVKDRLRAELGVEGAQDILVAIYHVEDDAAGERVPYSTPDAFIMGDIES